MLQKIGSDSFTATIVDPSMDRLTSPNPLCGPVTETWQREIWHDPASGLHFYNLKCTWLRKFSGFHRLHPANCDGMVVVPCFDLATYQASDAEAQEAFLEGFGRLLPLWNERNNRLRPLRDDADAAGRALMQEYMLHLGHIVQASGVRINGDRLEGTCTFYSGTKWRKNYYFHPVAEIKALGLWALTPEHEARLAGTELPQ